jgi:hypothetical protein
MSANNDPTTTTTTTATTTTSIAARPLPQCLPTTITRSFRIQDVPSHCFVQIFSDRIVVGITQLATKHIGTWVLCNATQSPIDFKSIDLDVSTLLGMQTTSVDVYARHITEGIIQQKLIPGSNRIVVLLGISLKETVGDDDDDDDRERFQLVTKVLTELIREALQIVLYET